MKRYLLLLALVTGGLLFSGTKEASAQVYHYGYYGPYYAGYYPGYIGGYYPAYNYSLGYGYYPQSFVSYYSPGYAAYYSGYSVGYSPMYARGYYANSYWFGSPARFRASYRYRW